MHSHELDWDEEDEQQNEIHLFIQEETEKNTSKRDEIETQEDAMTDTQKRDKKTTR